MKKHFLLCIVSFCVLIFGVNSITFAFSPTANHGHNGITQEALNDPSLDRSSSLNSTVTFSFSTRAILEIMLANSIVDFDQFSPEKHCDDEELFKCTKRLMDLKGQIINHLSAQSPDGSTARGLLGKALHTLQDFYSHSNWVEIYGPVNDTLLGFTTHNKSNSNSLRCLANTEHILAPGFDGNGISDQLTSGFFTISSILVPVPTGKCGHGFLLVPGIHKDDPSKDPLHTEARIAAKASTIKYINDILDSSGIKGNDKAIQAFMNVAGTLGFVVDDTGSMGPEIQGVKTSITNTINQLNAISQNQNRSLVSNFLLQRFGDPNIGTPFVTNNPNSLLSEVNKIIPNGGGDCPELSQTGLLKAIGSSLNYSHLIMYTDASAKDSQDKGKVSTAANKKNIRITHALTGSCSPIDPAYIEVSQRTGGQVFVLNESEVDKLFSLIKPSLTGDLEPLLLVNDLFGSTNKNYTFPIDTNISSLVLSFTTTSNIAVFLTRPSGQIVNTSDSDATVTSLTGGVIIQIDAPQTGNWQLTLSGTGDFSASIMGNTPININNFDFVEMKGRPGHQGLFPIDGQPVFGQQQTALANVVGPWNTANFELRDEAGNLIKSVNIVFGVSPEATINDFVGTLDLPNSNFRVYAKGTDNNGANFIRAYPPLFISQLVKVEALMPIKNIAQGSTDSVSFKITNFGGPDTFDFSAIDAQGFTSSLSNNQAFIDTDQSITIDVGISSTSSTPIDTTTTLIFEAISTTNPASNNSAISNIIVTVPILIGDLDLDGDVDRDDLSILLAARNTPSTGTGDPKDLDGDGSITALDARKLIQLCTRPRCATQ